MRKMTLFVAALLMAVVVSAQENQPKQIKLTEEERQMVQSNNDFAFRLFRQARTNDSQILSPLSITIDLGMLNNGADGITREEIDAVLGSKDVGGADVINSFCRKLLNETATLDEKTRVAIANNIYVNTRWGYQLLPAFTETANQYYDATPESRDFCDGKTRDVMNQWGSDHTEGMIEEAIKEDEFNEDAVSYLLNALYFKGEWTHKFDAAQTKRYQFDRGNKEVQMMHQQSEFSYAENNVYQSIVLPYGNKAYQMTVFLPRYSRTIADVLNELNGKNWQQAGYDTYHVNLMLPKFETSTDMHLEDIMKTLGMPNAFMGGYGFNEVVDDNVIIGMMKQVAKIKLDEEGTEASAVTVIGLDKNASEPRYAEFIADRPFLYVISESSTGAIFFIGQYMGEPLKNVRKDIQLTKEERELVQSNNDFAFNLMRKARTKDSQILSPLSITYALGMLNNGAAGKTQEEINTVLGFKTAGADAINQFCRKLLTEAPKLDEETTAEIANTIYVNSHWDYQLKEPFVEKAQQYYDATPEARDFYDDATRGVINQWASDHTHGMINEVLSKKEFEAGKDYVSYLMNALYFKGKWATPFNKEYTCEESFNGGTKVPMMRQGGMFVYTENDLYQAVKLPYGNGAYQMTVYLPRQGKTIDDVLDKLDGKSWQFNSSSWSIDLKLPRIETDTEVNLTPIMSALGMPTAFDPNNAEFPDFCNDPTYIDLMKQLAKIKLDEEGTEAAAVTVIGVPGSASHEQFAEFHATRPFLYIISELSTGAIFFIGQYMGDGTTGVGDAVHLNDRDQRLKNEYYNLNGQQLQAPPAKGLYISNGRKVLR